MRRLMATLVCWLLLTGLVAAQGSTGPWSIVRLGSDSGPVLTVGSGSPEGVVTAPIGSIYLRTDGGAGSSVYFKESGSGNTGWTTGALGGGGGSSHNLLSATHTDTSSAAAVRGAMITGNSAPAWARITPTTAGQYPRFNGTDTLWSLDGSLLEDLNGSEISTGTVPDARLSVNVSLFGAAVDNSEITNTTITFGKWASNSCSTNQIPKYNGSAWTCATDETGTGGGDHSILSLTHTDTVPDTLVEGDILVVNSSDLLERKAPGSEGDVLTIVSGVPDWAAPTGGGDFSSNTATSVDGEVVLFSGTGGKTGKRSTLTATVVKSTGGVLSAASAGTDYVTPAGNTATATAIAANGSNCSSGQFPLGVDASGAAESCTALPTTISGTSNEVAASASTGAVTLSLPSTLVLSGKTVRIPNSTSLPGTCTTGDQYMDTDATSGQRFYLCESSNTWVKQGDGTGATTRATGITIDGAGTAITTGVKGFMVVPFSGTITKVTLLSTDASATACSIVIDIWGDTYANYPPANADSITASAPPTLSSANKSQDSTLTGWTTSVTAGAIWGYNVDSNTGCTRVTLVAEIQ